MKQIVVICREVYTPLINGDAEIWTITDEGYESLGETIESPKGLYNKDILKIESCSDFVNDIAEEVGSLEQHLTEDKSIEAVSE